MTNIEILTECFRLLDDHALSNMRWHVDQKTPIFCGPWSDVNYVNLTRTKY